MFVPAVVFDMGGKFDKSFKITRLFWDAAKQGKRAPWLCEMLTARRPLLIGNRSIRS